MALEHALGRGANDRESFAGQLLAGWNQVAQETRNKRRFLVKSTRRPARTSELWRPHFGSVAFHRGDHRQDRGRPSSPERRVSRAEGDQDWAAGPSNPALYATQPNAGRRPALGRLPSAGPCGQPTRTSGPTRAKPLWPPLRPAPTDRYAKTALKTAPKTKTCSAPVPCFPGQKGRKMA